MLVRSYAAVVALLLLLAGPGRAASPVLHARVSPNDSFVIALTDDAGALVTHLEPGTYTIEVDDPATLHDFQLRGPGVEQATSYAFVGKTTWTVTFADGYYRYYCSPHEDQMHGEFTVGAAPPPTLEARAAGGSVSLTQGGAPVSTLQPGTYSIRVTDESTIDNVRLTGPGVDEHTQTVKTVTETWTVTLRDGTYTVFSERDPAGIRTRFTVGTPPGPSGEKRLTAITGPDFSIALLDADGAPATRLDPGAYAVTVLDKSDVHNFDLSGPGVSRATTQAFVGADTWNVTLRAGVYRFLCDPHAQFMRGTVTVGSAGGGSPPPPPPVRRLTATVSAAGRVSVSAAHLLAGTYAITVRDRSRRANFHLRGPGLNRRTSARFVGTVTWRARLRTGTYRYGSDPRLRGSLMVM